MTAEREQNIEGPDRASLQSGSETPSILSENRESSSGSVHLDALRGAAALLVFFGHTRALYFDSPVGDAAVVAAATSDPTPSPVKSSMRTQTAFPGIGAVRFASEAVIIFFVLSGYLVGGSVLRLVKTERWSWKNYLTKRLTRLYVVLVPALILGGTLDYIGSKIFGAGSVYTTPPGIQLVTTFRLVERFRPTVFFGDLLFLDNFRVPYIGTNVALWSLSNEFWYYIIFPMFCLALLWKGKAWWRFFWLVAALALMAFTGREMSIMFPLWILGALISVIPRRLSAKQAKWASAFTTLVLLTVMLGTRLLRLSAIPAYYLIALVAGVLLYFLAQQTDRARPGRYKTLANFFSKISYTLYLFHVPMAVFLCAMLNNPWHLWPKTPANLGVFLLAEGVLIGLAYLMWMAFESRTDSVRHSLFPMEEKAVRKSR